MNSLTESGCSIFFLKRVQQMTLIIFLAQEQIYRRYCGSLLGMAWSLVHPLCYILILTLVFTTIIPVHIDRFAIYLSAGLMPWSFLSNALVAGTRSLTDRRGVLESSPLCGLTFILADTTAEFLSFLPGYGLLIGIVILVRPELFFMMLILPVAFLPFVLFVYSISIVTAYLSARFNDIPHLLQIFMTIMFWMVPIVYHPQSIPQYLAPFLQMNPISVLISPSQVMLHGGMTPTFKNLTLSYLVAGGALVFAFVVHRVMNRRIIYYL
ncbi:MAG: hypothetical protein WCF85_13260 [Rhodospirillaceae bacterium]